MASTASVLQDTDLSAVLFLLYPLLYTSFSPLVHGLAKNVQTAMKSVFSRGSGRATAGYPRSAWSTMSWTICFALSLLQWTLAQELSSLPACGVSRTEEYLTT
jgi:hypothetical protein